MKAREARVVIPAFSAFFVLLAAVLIVLGVHDAALARVGLGVVVGSAVLVVIGVVLLVAAYQLAHVSRRISPDGHPACKPLVLVAFLLVVLLSVYVFFSAIRIPSTQRIYVVVVVLSLLAVALAGLHVFGRDARVTLPRLGTIALGLAGTTIGAWQFWYQNQYVPSRASRAVVLKVDLRAVRVEKGYDVIRATVNYEDVGRASVAVIGSAYSLTGSGVVRCYRPAIAKKVQNVFNGFLPDPQRSRFTTDVREVLPPDVLAAGKFVGDGKRLDSNVEATRGFVFFVPHGKYQLLRFRAQLFAIPASIQLSQRTLPTYDFKPDNNLYGFWHVDDDSWFHALVYGRERWVVLRYELVEQPSNKARTSRRPVHPKVQVSPDLRVLARFPAPTWRAGPPDKDQVYRLFKASDPTDASEPFAGTELALERVAEPTAEEGARLKCQPATR